MQYRVILKNETNLGWKTGIVDNQRTRKPVSFELLQQNRFQGFTLIELLVTIAIIGLLASVILVALADSRKKARDARRLADMAQLQKALDMYYNQNNSVYPGSTGSYGEAEGVACGWDSSGFDKDGDGKPFIEPLLDKGITNKVPSDPIDSGVECTGGTYSYRYYRYGSSATCDPCNGKAFYVLGVNNFEKASRPHPDSPGWKCINPTTGAVTSNWQSSFSWVAGRCE